MNSIQPESLLFDGVANWLVDQGLRELALDELVRGLGQRLVAGGIPIHRISIGGMILHPIYGAIDVTWDGQSDMARYDKFPRSNLILPEFQNAPFYHAITNNISFERFKLEDDTTTQPFPIFEKFRNQGVTDYIVAFHSYGREEEILWADLPPGMQGILCSFSTRRIGGFTDREIEYLRALTRPLSLSVKASTTHELAQTVLDTYLGRYSGGQVLDGLVERGDGKLIDCVLWYSDLRDSTPLADSMPLDDFLGMVNDYFECTAGAVIDHGGEVLRFIGDAVIAIFPYEAEKRPLIEMTRAAVATAREAIARVDRINTKLSDTDRPPIRFGVSMHIGSVMYGNIGTDRRLEFSVIGPAANEVVRLESLCKKLETPVLVSSSFNDIYPEELISLGTHAAAGVKTGLAAYTFSEFQPDPKAGVTE